MKLKKITAVLVLLIFTSLSNAQQSLVYAHENADFKRAKELFTAKKYVAAQRKFKKVYDKINEPHSEVKMNAEYYVALCALELFNQDAEYLFVRFIEHHPQSPKVRRARFQLGQYNYRKKRWTTAIKWFEQVDENDLEVKELPEYQFKYGYALFCKKRYPEAQKLFHKSKSVAGDYQKSSQFYFAHLSYKFNFYEIAYKEFKNLENDSVFAPIVPYYITQILYLQNKNEELVNYGAPFLKKSNTKRAPEIARLVGEGFYKLGNYDSSVVYFEKFKERVTKMDTMAYFQLGYSYYKNGEYEKALDNLNKSSDDETQLGQLSMYYSGDCYIHLDKKRAARRAFRNAHKNHHDFEITENALFNYAKLSFELDIDPYHESIIALENYIYQYPKSANVDRARKILLNVYLNTQDYPRAISALEKIKNKGPELNYAYQKVTYYKGIQEFNDQKIGFANKGKLENFRKAIYYFNKSLSNPEDREIVALANYWKAESFYKLDEFKAALAQYEVFKSSSGAILLDEYKEVDYQLGYTNMRLREYGPAIKAFRNYLNKHSNDVPTDKIKDAYLRTGDAYLILSNGLTGAEKQNELIHAVKYYKKAITIGERETDYGYFQLGQAYKLLNKYELEAEAFENLIFNYPASKYIDDSKFKAGDVYYQRLEKFDIAYKYFQDIVDNHQNNTALVQQSLNKMANIKRDRKLFQESAKLFESAVQKDPKTEYAANALRGLRQVATFDLKDVNRYLNFRANLGLPDESLGAKDTLVFESAKGYYKDKEYIVATNKLETYLSDFPNGIFSNDANYMIAESYFALNQENQSLPYFEKVIEAPYGEWTEEALYKASAIYMQNEEYQKAIGRFLLLVEKTEYDVYEKDALVGLMIAYSRLEDFESTVQYALQVERNKLTENSNKFQARLLLGNAYLKSHKYDSAFTAFEKIANETQKVMAAEAIYQMSYIKYLKEDYKTSQELAIRLLKEFSNYPYWYSKGYILLADILIKNEALVDAKYALKNVLEHSTDQKIIDEVNKRLAEIEAIEQAALKVVEKEEVFIDIGDENNVNEELFNVEEEESQEPLDSLNFDTTNPSDSLKQE
ncbi:MAG: hypothetical protein CMP63_02160 [Flavobacteriales bacterium]|nr:hypothetical protein [Flavobacteriales bacterium]